MNGRRLQFGISVIDGLLFVVGGRDGLKTLNTVECFDPKKKQWTMMTSMGTHRHGLGQSQTFCCTMLCIRRLAVSVCLIRVFCRLQRFFTIG